MKCSATEGSVARTVKKKDRQIWAMWRATSVPYAEACAPITGNWQPQRFSLRERRLSAENPLSMGTNARGSKLPVIGAYD